MKHEWRKKEKSIYLPKQTPSFISLQPMNYFTIEGAGNPNSEAFSDAVGALYAMSYGIRMAPKKGIHPEGYFEYTVYPLEGFWSLNDKGIEDYKAHQTFNKDDLLFKLMIRQPDFVTETFALETIARISKDKPHPYNEEIKFETIEEGNSVQALHIGPYDTESETFNKINDFCETNSYIRLSPTHKEIYLSDPRKTVPEKCKTVLRIAVK